MSDDQSARLAPRTGRSGDVPLTPAAAAAEPLPVASARAEPILATAALVVLEAAENEGGTAVRLRSNSAWRRFAAHRVALSCLVLLGILLLLALGANLLPLQNPRIPARP